jgi:hypothetical protein
MYCQPDHKKGISMSHIVEAKTSIQHPDQALLSQAVNLVSQQHGGTVDAFYLDYYGKRHPIPLAVFTPQLRRGIGITVNETTGELTFVGDAWGVQGMYQQVQQEVLQMYVSLATMQALQTMGYSSQAIEGQPGTGQVVIQGVSYA